MDITKIGKFIANRRKELGFTQSELGEWLEVSNKSVSKWERGVCLPEVTLLSRLAVILKVSVMELMEGELKVATATSDFIHSHDEIDIDIAGLWQESNRVELKQVSQSVVSPYLFGSNLEHTRSDVLNGLSAQMLRNRKFAGKPAAVAGYAKEWYPIGEKVYFMLNYNDPYTRHMEGHYHMKRRLECNAQRIANFTAGSPAGIGQHGLVLHKDKEYEFAIVLRSGKPGTITVLLTNRGGSMIYARESITFSSTDSKEWNRYCVKLQCDCRDEDADLRVIFTEENYIEIGAVSLMSADHFRGMRMDVIEALREQGIKLLRWPGGNFAGEYNWFDGLLPVDMRAPFESYMGLETQPHSMGYDYHELNTDDFVALCRLIGAEPFITINPAWNTPSESAMWVEYCNGGPDTEYGRKRIERGYEEPYHVQLWSLGNEFGYGHMEGENTPYGYSKIAREHADAMKAVCKELTFCSSGPYPNKDWADHSAKALKDVVSLTSLHFYAPQREFTLREKIEEDYRICVASVENARERIHRMRCQLGDSTQISFDEWNTWYAWYRPSCVADGIFTALMLHMIIEESEKSGIAMACHFEAVNEGTIEANWDGARLTAAGQAFAAMTEHSGGMIRYQSANVLATEKEQVLTVTMVNASFEKEQTLWLPDCGRAITADLYYGREMIPYSYFEIRPAQVEKESDRLRVNIPAHSLVLIKVKLV